MLGRGCQHCSCRCWQLRDFPGLLCWPGHLPGVSWLGSQGWELGMLCSGCLLVLLLLLSCLAGEHQDTLTGAWGWWEWWWWWHCHSQKCHWAAGNDGEQLLPWFPTTMWTPALLKTSLSRWGEWDPTLCPPRALDLPHSLSLWVCLLLMDKAGDEKEAQGAACTTRSRAQR